VQDYLSGNANAMPGRPAFDSGGQTLLGAQMQPVPNFQAQGGNVPFVQGQTATANAPSAAQSITQVFTIPLTPSGPSEQWSVDDSTGGLVGDSAFWHDLCNFPHDIDHAIRKAALAVTDMAVDVENKIVHVTMQLANGLSQLLKLVINTVEDVVSAIKCAFRYVERGIEEAIDWLKALFDWHDILNTKNVIEAGVNGLMMKLADVLNPASPNSVEALVNNAFSNAETTITAAFANAAQYFEPSDSFQSTTNSVPYPAGATPIGTDPLNPNTLNNAQADNGTHTNYVQTHTNNYANQGGTFPALTSGGSSSTDSTFQSLTNTVTQNTASGTSYQKDHGSFLSTLESVFSSRQSFVDTIMLDLINAAEDAVLDVLKFIDSMIQDLLSLAYDAISGFTDMLNKGIDIPVISWIWKEISGHSLTMLDLFSLGLAVPTTILYKLTFGLPGAAAPFTDTEAQQIVEALSNPQTFPWPILGSGVTAVSTSPFTPEVISTMQKVLVAPSALTFMLADWFNDFVGWSNLNEGGILKQTAPFAAGSKIVGGLLLRFALTPKPVLEGTPIATEVDKWTLANWSAGFLPILSLLALALRPVAIPGFGMMVSSVIGCGLLGVGVATDVEQDKLGSKVPFNIARNVIAPLPNIVKSALMTPGEPEAAIALAGVSLVDAYCDLATGSLALAADLT
jgi:hypothetical protein